MVAWVRLVRVLVHSVLLLWLVIPLYLNPHVYCSQVDSRHIRYCQVGPLERDVVRCHHLSHPSIQERL